MATESSVTKYCLLCGNELPSGGFSAQVAGVYLYPVCADCQDRCSSDPAGVVAEHPQLFEGSEITNPDIHPTSHAFWVNGGVYGEVGHCVHSSCNYLVCTRSCALGCFWFVHPGIRITVLWKVMPRAHRRPK
jgi:hypothetical protein